MLRSLYIRNLRGISSGNVDGLTDVNVFVGKNNSGKSTILDSIYLLNNIFYPDDCFGNYILDYILSKKSGETNRDSLYYKYQRNNDIKIDVEYIQTTVGGAKGATDETKELVKNEASVLKLSYGDGVWRVPNLLISNTRSDEEIMNAIGSPDDKRLPNIDSIDDLLKSQTSHWNNDIQRTAAELRRLKSNIYNTQYFHSGIFQIFESMETDIWKKLHRTRGDKEVYSAINEIYNENIDHITYTPGEDGEHLRLLYDDYASASSSLGDGLRFTFILLSALESYNPSVALIEEPENHQHPSAYSGLADAYSSYSQQNQTQLFIATHSYDFIRELTESTKEYGLDLSIFHLSLEEGDLQTRKMNRPDVEVLEDIGIDPRRLKEYG